MNITPQTASDKVKEILNGMENNQVQIFCRLRVLNMVGMR
jgi:hypothetical protein